ncbi:acetolactate decarboxylase [Pseudohongiella spirulinae]|uniref:Putative decarboxylase n=1 Tax=Pseudohongiella spirulinae TaxID=1249552 RepID=A0A0S2KFB3_9GAMM|nr:acetolactate decarboxylase [Pseudohongiella spirulinae]ALO46869.1 Putative decarboxylase [Pseudohongiella spirulinae]
MQKFISVIAFMTLSACSGSLLVNNNGWVEYAGRQGDIVVRNNIEGLIPITAMSGRNGAFGVGAYQGLDGEITIFEGKPYVTHVRGESFTMTHSTEGAAIFGAWTQNSAWRDEPVPADVNTYAELQRFIRTQAAAVGIDTRTTAFPFLLSGRARELQWHININRTAGQEITRESFQASKDNYIMQNEEVDIVGFYSELHNGVFIGTYAPAMAGEPEQNALHLHLVSRDRQSAGHIDDLRFEGQMTLRLPEAPEPN